MSHKSKQLTSTYNLENRNRPAWYRKIILCNEAIQTDIFETVVDIYVGVATRRIYIICQ